MAIEDFEWEGEIEVEEPARAVVAARRSWWARLRESVWLEPALRMAGVALVLIGLSALGVIATTYAKPGVQLPETPAKLAAVLGTSWLKPTPPAAEPSHAHGAASASAAPVPLEVPEQSPRADARVTEPAATSGPASTGQSQENAAEGPALRDDGAPVGVTAEGKVILNLASAAELTKLPGVGMKRAESIVALRTKLKRFRQVTDLLRVKGIGPRGLKRMLPHLVLDPT